MVSIAYLLTVMLAGLGLVAGASVSTLQAAPPGIQYASQVLGIDTAQCLGRARQALEAQGLEPVQNDATSIVGRSEVVTALLVCVEHSPATTTVMVVVASTDDDQALALREALQMGF